jgi:ribonuclease HI
MKSKSNLWIAYTDGAASGNPGPGGWGFLLVSPGGAVLERSGGNPATTSNRMELAAAAEAADTVRIRDPKGSLVIRTDSKYVCDGFEKGLARWPKSGWKTIAGTPVQHQDLWEILLELRERVRFEKIPGHAGYAPNERVDALAVAASQGRSADREWTADQSYSIPREVLLGDIPRESLKKWGSPIYLSLMGGKLERHSTWAECEKRVKGQGAAKFKKVQTDAEEARTLELWGVSDSSD